MKKYCLISIMLSMIFIVSSLAGDAMTDLKVNIDTVIDMIKNKEKASTPEEKAIQRKKIFEIAQNLFNFTEMSKRTLGKDWKQLSPEKQKQFSDLFARFLANIYYQRLGEYTNEKVKYLGQRQHKNKSLVKTVIVTQKNEIPMDYKMLKTDKWRIYDVSIEGVSLIQNYRSQFHKILRTQGFDNLMTMMTKKLGQFSEL